jgi:hypothetical protein
MLTSSETLPVAEFRRQDVIKLLQRREAGEHRLLGTPNTRTVRAPQTDRTRVLELIIRAPPKKRYRKFVIATGA